MRRAAVPLNQSPRLDVLHSNLLAELFRAQRQGERLMVLDFGYASPSTVEFFSQFKCRLDFIDIYSQQFVVEADNECSHGELVKQFTEAISLDADCKLDICLFWEFFNYLDGPALKALMVALEPNIDQYSRGHSLGLLNARNQLPFNRYGIHSSASLSQAEREGEQPLVYPHSQRELNSLLDYWEIDKSRLMPDGRVEYILLENRNPQPAAGRFL